MSDYKLDILLSAVDKASSVIDFVKNKLGALGKAAQQADKMIQIGKNMQQSGSMTLAAANKMQNGLTSVLSPAAAFQKGMGEISTLIPGQAKQIGQLKGELLKLAAVYPENEMNNFTDGLYNTISAGVPAAQSLRFLESSAKLAAAGVTDINTVVDGSTAVMKAYGIEWEKADKINTLFFKTMKLGKTTVPEVSHAIKGVAATANAAGVDIKDSFAVFSTLSGVTGSTNEVGTQFKAMLSNIIIPSKKAQDLAKELGLEFNVTALKTKGLGGFMADLADKTGGNIETLGKLFGSTEALNAVSALTGNQLGVLKTNMAEMRKNTDPVSTGFTTMAQTMEHSLASMSKASTILKIIIGDQLAPVIDFAAKIIGTVATKLQMMAQNNPGLTRVAVVLFAGATAVLTFAGATMFATGTLISMYGQMLKGIGGILKFSGWLKTGILRIITFGKSLLISGVAGIKSFASSLLTGAATALSSFVGAMGTAIASAWSFTVALLANPITWIVIGVMALIGGLVYLAMNFDVVKNVFISVWEVLKSGIGWIFENLWFLLGPLGLIVHYWDNIKSALLSFWDVAKSVFSDVLSWLKSIMDYTINIINSIGKFLGLVDDTADKESEIRLKKTIETIPTDPSANLLSGALEGPTGSFLNNTEKMTANIPAVSTIPALQTKLNPAAINTSIPSMDDLKRNMSVKSSIGNEANSNLPSAGGTGGSLRSTGKALIENLTIHIKNTAESDYKSIGEKVAKAIESELEAYAF